MNRIITAIISAAFGAGLLASPALAGQVAPSQQDSRQDGPFQGVVIVPASASPRQDASPAAEGFTRGTRVAFAADANPGDIIVDTHANRLYYVLGAGEAMMFRVATAKRGFEWRGTHQVSSKMKWPDWRPPADMRKRRPELPAYVAGGPENPLGARAIYLGSSLYRIHGTNEPSSIGKAASSGCIRMLNEDVSELYRHVKIGARVTVM